MSHFSCAESRQNNPPCVARFWEVTWRISYDPEMSANVSNVASTDLRDDPTYINVYITWLYLVVMYIVPFTCLAAFNLLIYHEVQIYGL